MCELLGMECNVPTDIVFSFAGLASRGGKAGPHSDGWGLALYDGNVARTVLEPTPAANSPLAKFVRDHPIKTLLAIAHVRRKTRGAIGVANTHPFVRELWGRHFVFAHNGTVKKAKHLKLGRFKPIGETDSEHAFCALLSRLDEKFRDHPGDKLAPQVAKIGSELGDSGTFNFLLGDGRQLLARCSSKLHYIVRKAPFKRATLADEDLIVDFAQVTTPKDRVAVIATQPLTRDESWTAGVPGELWVFKNGSLRASLPSRL